MSETNKVPIWLHRREVGGGLPDEIVYSHSCIGPTFGYIIMPKGMTRRVYSDYIDFVVAGEGRKPQEVVASLSSWRAVQAAVRGEFGLSWEARS